MNYRKSQLLYPLIAFAVGILVWLSSTAGLFVGLEHFFEDLLFSQKPIQSDIVIISIDNESIERIGQWPWPRAVFAEAFANLSEHPPQVVGLDVMFSEESRWGAADDVQLARMLDTVSYPVVLPIEATQLLLAPDETPQAISIVEPLPFFQTGEMVALGSVNVISDRDGIVRKFPVEIAGRTNDDTYLSFAHQVAHASGQSIPHEEDLKAVERIVYAAPTGFIRHIPFWRLLDSDEMINLEGDIVLIGATAADLHDSSPVAFGRGKDMSGVEIHANIANMLLSGYRLTPLGEKLSLLWILVAALLPAALFVFLYRQSTLIGVSLFFGLLYFVGIIILFEKGIVVNFVHVTAAWVISTTSLFGYRFFRLDKEKHEMKGLFSKYVSDKVLREILRRPKHVSLGGEEKEVTILFSDIRGFTSLSENTTPQELVNILNTYFSAMTEEILKHDGVLDKYIGDAIMAYWGAPISDPEQADKALRAATGMVKRLEELNEEREKRGETLINIGIGIYTGPVIVGNIGSELRFDYTVIGDAVNAASRLEGLNKEYKTTIIIGENTKQKLQDEHNLTSLGSVLVKGKTKPIDIYTLSTDKNDGTQV